MIIVTGGAGFIGSNIIRGLNKMGCQEILVVDDNLANLQINSQQRDGLCEGARHE